MLRINISTANAEITETEKITAGRVGLRCGFTFDSAWDGLAKTAVVSGVVRRDRVLVGDEIEVPGECLIKENFLLRIGVVGKNGDGTVVIPTVWANFGKILPSAEESGETPAEPTPDVVAQIQQNSANALLLAQRVMQMAENGEFDGEDGTHIWWTTARVLPYGSGGGVSTRQLNGVDGVTPAVRDYVLAPEIEQSGEPTTLYVITQTTAVATAFDRICSIKGADGSGIWYTTARISGGENPFVRRRDLTGREGATAQVHDLLFAPDVGCEGVPTTLYEITSAGTACELNRLCKMQGANGTDGASAYELAVEHGYAGTEEEWLESLKGAPGSDYVLTNADKAEIAGLVLAALPTWDGGDY